MASTQAPQPRLIIVLDTQAFDAVFHQTDFGKLGKLREIADKRQALIAIPDVQCEEIKAHLKRDVGDTKKVVNALLVKAGARSIRKPDSDKSDAGIPLPRMLKHEWIRKALDSVAVAADASAAACLKFLSSVTVIPSGHVTASRILPNYFNEAPPFSARKKDEFPDAIALEALKDFVSARKGTEFIVVSGDSDWRNVLAGIPDVLVFEGTPEVLQHLNDLDQVAEMIKKVLMAESSRLVELIPDEFVDLKFSLEEEWGADIENVEVDEATISRLDVTSLKNHIAAIEFEAEVTYTCTARYPDDNWTEWHQVHKIAHIKATVPISGAASVNLTDDDFDVEEVEEVFLEGPVQVSLDDAGRIDTKGY